VGERVGEMCSYGWAHGMKESKVKRHGRERSVRWSVASQTRNVQVNASPIPVPLKRSDYRKKKRKERDVVRKNKSIEQWA